MNNKKKKQIPHEESATISIDNVLNATVEIHGGDEPQPTGNAFIFGSDGIGGKSLSINPEDIPVLPLRNMVVFPMIPVAIPVGRDSSKLLVSDAESKRIGIFLVTQKNPDKEKPEKLSDLNQTGCMAHVLKVVEHNDDTLMAFVSPFERGTLKKILSANPYMTGKIAVKRNKDVKKDSLEEFQTIMDMIHEIFGKITNFLDDSDKNSIREAVKSQADNPRMQIYHITANSPLDSEERQHILDESSLLEQARILLKYLDLSYQKMELRARIMENTRVDITRQQKEDFLHRQIRAMQDELNENDEDSDYMELRKRADMKKWDDDTENHFQKELRKLQRLNPQTPDYSVQYGYLDNFLNLPWKTYTTDKIVLKKIEQSLNKDHYGLKEVKERILEHMAVLKLRGDMKAPIICLYGPPGVGKTSLGRSIAESIGREYVRISLGGLHDEAEIRGHRKTYIGALPGRILGAMAKCKSGNPVFVLDEIDKIGTDFKGDPSTALLEVLDPEQNSKFHDNYIDCDYDLSHVMFIATANDLGKISEPLLDRMELINISGYVTEEKIEIARHHLIPKVQEENGMGGEAITFNRNALEYIIEHYTRENGVRQLEQNLSKIMRKLAHKKASGEKLPLKINKESVPRFLGKEKVMPDMYENSGMPGVVTGLAWTSVGGDILFIESSLSGGKEGKLSLTGNLGKVMKESAEIALQYIKANADVLGINSDLFQNNLHVHVPEGAIPKDGPSAGITMVTSMVSTFTGKLVRPKIAMTGEITLRGKVLPVGGIKEKMLAARRAGITDIALSSMNRKDVEEIPSEYLKDITFHYFDSIADVIDFAIPDFKK